MDAANTTVSSSVKWYMLPVDQLTGRSQKCSGAVDLGARCFGRTSSSTRCRCTAAQSLSKYTTAPITGLDHFGKSARRSSRDVLQLSSGYSGGLWQMVGMYSVDVGDIPGSCSPCNRQVFPNINRFHFTLENTGFCATPVTSSTCSPEVVAPRWSRASCGLLGRC